MAVFAYVGIDAAERQLAGTLIADTPQEGRRRLRERGLRLLEFEPARWARRRFRGRAGPSHRRREQVTELARSLSLLLGCGTPLADSLAVLTRRRESKLVTVLTALRDRVINGAAFGDALAEHPDWFDALFVGAVRVGELSGQLEDSLAELAEHLRARQTLRAQITGALTYPLILVCVGIGVVLFLMSYVIPQLLTVLTASGQPLPASTRFLKAVSDLIVGYWPLLLIVVVASTALVTAALRRAAIRRAVQLTLLRVPILGPLLQKTLVTQFAQAMSMLLKTGTPFVDAVRSVGNLTRNNEVLRNELAAVARAVESGSDIAPTLEGSRIFPPLVVHLIAVGQDSGELTGMLAELKNRYETEVRIAVTRFTGVLEPLLIVLLAAGVGFVVFACLMPILEATRGIAA